MRYIFKEHIVCERLYSAVHWDIKTLYDFLLLYLHPVMLLWHEFR